MSQLTDLTARQLAVAVAAGQTSAVEATQAYLDAIAARDQAIAAYNDTFAQRAIQQAGHVHANQRRWHQPKVGKG